MSLLTILRKGIKTADKIVKTLEPTVTFEKYVRLGDGFGTPNYATAVSLRAIVEWKEVQVPSSSGIVAANRPTVMFIDIAALMAATGGEGVKEEDRITLGDGTTGPTRTLEGFFDAGTNRPIYTQIYLG